MNTNPDAVLSADGLPLLHGLSNQSRENLLRHAIAHAVAPGTVLFEQGQLPNFQIVVMSGAARLFGLSKDGREVLIEIVRPPDLIIPAAVVTGAPYLMEARVSEPSRLLLIQAAAFREAVAREPALAEAVIGSLAQQFRRMVRQIKNLKLRTSAQRVGCYVLALAQSQGTPDRAVLPYEKNLIASELGITRESFSRALSSLESVGIRVEGQTIAILDRTRLAAECVPDPFIDGTDAPEPEAVSLRPAPA